jgi:hypothetical protein
MLVLLIAVSSELEFGLASSSESKYLICYMDMVLAERSRKLGSILDKGETFFSFP